MTLEQTASDRLTEVFTAAGRAHRAALVGYLVCGDPDLDTTLQVVEAVVAAGVDVIELGIPYGDPLGDGPTVAAGAQRALEGGTTIEDSFRMAERVSRLVPVLFFTYFNVVYQYGIERFADRAAAVGVAGAIVPDVPLEEVEKLRQALAERGLALPLLIAPTTPRERAARIAQASQGFIYLISRVGVTGGRRQPDVSWVRDEVEELRAVTDTPIAVGFGISTPEQARAIAEVADGVVIGSALIDAYRESVGAIAATRAGDYISAIAGALRT